jgi:hypothetical protein
MESVSPQTSFDKSYHRSTTTEIIASDRILSRMDPKRVNLSRQGFVAPRIGTIRFSRIATVTPCADYSAHAELSGSTVVAFARGTIRRYTNCEGI